MSSCHLEEITNFKNKTGVSLNIYLDVAPRNQENQVPFLLLAEAEKETFKQKPTRWLESSLKKKKSPWWCT